MLDLLNHGGFLVAISPSRAKDPRGAKMTDLKIRFGVTARHWWCSGQWAGCLARIAIVQRFVSLDGLRRVQLVVSALEVPA
jgi:hypothetical protein